MIGARRADVIVEPDAGLERADQPAAQRVVDLQAGVAIQHAGTSAMLDSPTVEVAVNLTVVSGVAVHVSEPLPAKPLSGSSRGSSYSRCT